MTVSVSERIGGITFDDVYAVAEALIAEGVTGSDRLGLVGESNGGLLAGAGLPQRPDLFRVVVPIASLLDLMRHSRDPYLAEYAVE
jgi:prolyl oligopeptidase